MSRTITPAVLFVLAAHAIPAMPAESGSVRDEHGEHVYTQAEPGKTGSSRQENSATLVGRNALARVGGDTIETRNGRLTVNGLPYGKVQDKSVIRYTAKGKEKTLSVDGVVRTPALPAR